MLIYSTKTSISNTNVNFIANFSAPNKLSYNQSVILFEPSEKNWRMYFLEKMHQAAYDHISIKSTL